MTDDKIEIIHIPDNNEKPKWKGKPFEFIPQLNPSYQEKLPEGLVDEILKLLDKQVEIHRKMIPYSLMCLFKVIDGKLWIDIYEKQKNED